MAQSGSNPSLYTFPGNVETRWASPENPAGAKGQAGKANGGRKGSPAFPLPAGEQRVLAEVSGTSGTIRRIWVTINDLSPRMLRGLKLDFYWDGAQMPAVSAPLGDFFGTGLGQTAAFESALFASPQGRSFLCYVPMPFRQGMKVVVTNETDTDLQSFYYDVDYTIGDRHGEDTLYFHAYFKRENPTRLQQDYELLPKLEGKGHFLGANFGVIIDQKQYGKTWWGEGEVKLYLDDDGALPTLSGTGTEDYIGTGWMLGQYANLYQGCLLADYERMRYCGYRYHIPDPIYFHHNIRVTIQQIGIILPHDVQGLIDAQTPIYKAGPGLVEMDKKRLEPFMLFEREDDWSSCSYFYLDKPENRLPPLVSIGNRTQGL
ncbi:MAG TPA: glycoside hydrolase family 172 protein [Anaerolineales bacterium]|nr:glycoside hydrolase family 172 protein [Anaerolineales bacterium]